jgi:hypothetical protein
VVARRDQPTRIEQRDHALLGSVREQIVDDRSTGAMLALERIRRCCPRGVSSKVIPSE